MKLWADVRCHHEHLLDVLRHVWVPLAGAGLSGHVSGLTIMDFLDNLFHRGTGFRVSRTAVRNVFGHGLFEVGIDLHHLNRLTKAVPHDPPGERQSIQGLDTSRAPTDDTACA
ncbi:hypothetical protein LCGC14_2780430, partial [marine sediment metagenome]